MEQQHAVGVVIQIAQGRNTVGQLLVIDRDGHAQPAEVVAATGVMPCDPSSASMRC